MDATQSRILVRVKVDDTHADLLAHLMSCQGRRRARRIVFLAALGLLAERGALTAYQISGVEKVRTTPEAAVGSGTSQLKPLTTQPDDLNFLATLRKSLP